MKLLAIETSTRAGSIAIARDGDIIERELGGSADQTLMPAILDLCTLRELDGVAVGLGPGMFTSMRVGVATAKTLASALGLRLAGVASLDAIARAAGAQGGTVVARLDAGRGEVYEATYRAVPFERMSDYRVVPVSALEPGPGVIPAGGVPRAAVLAEIAREIFSRGEAGAPNDVEPLYVRRSDAEINWERRGGITRPDRVKARGE